jgi:type I site-specific restriction-modification system R (restriction) subunit
MSESTVFVLGAGFSQPAHLPLQAGLMQGVMKNTSSKHFQDVGENKVTVWLVDWKQPEKNNFAIAEEVTLAAADAKAHEKHPDVVI